jgi:nitrogen fixation NifU-like protein
MGENEQLYREIILEHYRSPHNKGKMQKPDAEAIGANPFCGDSILVHLKLKGNILEDIKFDGAGCAISVASASMVSDKLKGMKIGEIRKLGDSDIVKMIGMDPGAARIRCARLALETVKKALAGKK